MSYARAASGIGRIHFIRASRALVLNTAVAVAFSSYLSAAAAWQLRGHIILKKFLGRRRIVYGSRANVIYELLGWKFKHATDWRFMNYGYAFNEDDRPVLLGEDEPERFSAQLYHVVASQVDLAGKRVLDVGSGRGGGTSHVHRYLHPRQTVGIDLAGSAIAFCQRVYVGITDLRFQLGDAMKMPFGEAEFDAVLSVESSHCYPDKGAFFNEVHRVLRPGGSFLYADFTLAGESAAAHSNTTNSELLRVGIEPIEFSNITDNVVRGLELDHTRRKQEIYAQFPFGTRRLACLWAGTRESWIFQDFKDGSRDYVMCRAIKST
jgi:SAM-dependent methyltransferase